MKTQNVTYLILFFILSTVATAQQLYLETGKTSSSFNYKDSQGVALDNLQATSHNFLAMGYRTKFLTNKLNTSLGARYSGYGAIGSDETLEGILEWNVNYLEFDYSLDYRLFTINKIQLYLKGMASIGFLLQGTQSVNNEIISLKNIEDFDSAMISFKTGGGFLYPVSDELSFYAEYIFGKSLNQADHNGNESLKIKSKIISFGVLIKLFKNVSS
ncbi:hypothetical protein [Flavivirga spongiicola]|uniref:Outer membrane protein beta-barrel domain-containing protein n=1 Tax=Flavivirga spongiicola TaxID=421621 RepID=A0ABU7XWA1_9FLAO|nr:hypothetical protein [Flavivirga sp. MEBiC05379]MDO5979710.1 hypothetical protein [Flavivirga sp. MEBiC05379]